MSLNRYQTGAVEDPAPYVVVRAGAGTGKTRTLLARAIAEADRADRVRLVAFTRSAAREMRERLESMDLPDDVVRRIHVETLHGLSHSLLRSHGAEGLASDFSVIDEVDEQTIEKHAERHWESAQNIRARAGLVRYDDLLHLAERSLVTGRADNERGGSVLLDEAQDLTDDEWRMIAAIAPDRITVVGDHAQAIYGFRGGLPDFVAACEKYCGNAAVLTLPLNYRSRQNILNVANDLAIPGRLDLQAHRGPGGVVEVWQAISDAELAGRIVETMAWDSPGDWAILSRKKGRLASIAETLIDEGIPVHAPALAGLFWKSKEARAFLDQIHVAVNPHDTHRLRRVLEAAGWDRMDFARAEEGRARDACSLWDWSCRNVEPESQAADLLRRLEALRMSEASAYEAAALLGADPLLVDGLTFCGEQTPAEFLEWLADPGARMADTQAKDAVTLATIHGAKGLEWPNVIVVGCEESIMPVLRKDTDMQEERRLFYVATTRAADRLILAHCRRAPTAWGRGSTEAQRSRFLAEVGL